MSADQLQALMAAGAQDPAIRRRFAAAKSSEEAVGIARELGFDVTAKDLAAADSDELSEAELGTVSGGTAIVIFTMECWTKGFNCLYD